MPEQEPIPATVETPAAPVLLEVSGGVATVTFNRADAMNSLDIATKEAAARDPAARWPTTRTVRCVVLTGTGRAFCVGQDLREHVEPAAAPRRVAVADRAGALQPGGRAHRDDEQAGHRRPERGRRRSGRRVRLRGGPAGARRHAPASTSPSPGIALSCDSGSSWSLPRLVGTARAKELLLMPRTVPRRGGPGDRASRRRWSPPTSSPAPCAELAATLAAGPTLAYGSIRRAVAYSRRAHAGRVPGAGGRVHGAHRRQRGPRARPSAPSSPRSSPTFTGR